MSYRIADQFPDDIIFDKSGPFVSLYQPTHRSYPENKQDPIVFKNLLRRVDNALKQQTEKHAANSIMKPLYELEGDKHFWNNTSDGIAVLASQSQCVIYVLHNPVEELTVVADSFHIKPLLKAFQSVDSYYLLGLSLNNFALYQGNRFGFSKIAIDPDVPVTLEDVLGKQLTEPYITQGSFGGTGEPAVYHGQRDKKEEADKDTEKYFRYVDRYVFENYSKPSNLPLILVSLKEHHALFKVISHNPYLVEAGINHSFESLDMAQLKRKALEIIEPLSLSKTQKLSEAFENAYAQSLGSSDIAQVARAAFESRVETVMIEEDKIIPGKIDHSTGDISFCDTTAPGCDDILNDIAKLVMQNKGAVLVLSHDNMPVSTGVAAIYRYQQKSS